MTRLRRASAIVTLSLLVWAGAEQDQREALEQVKRNEWWWRRVFDEARWPCPEACEMGALSWLRGVPSACGGLPWVTRRTSSITFCGQS